MDHLVHKLNNILFERNAIFSLQFTQRFLADLIEVDSKFQEENLFEYRMSH